jgi:capsular polysaccharide biosynthesis protein
MSTRRREPDLDAEQEVDLGRYARAVAARWWLPVAGLVAGAIVGYLISLGGTQVWKASATVYLGQPYSYPGNTPLQSQQTNPTSVGTIARSEEAIDAAAAAASMKPAQLRGKVSTQSISGGTASVGTTRIQQNPLVRITVQAPTARKARIAANSLARQVVERLSTYGASKVQLLEARVASDQQQIDAMRKAGRADSATGVLAGQFLQDQLSAKLALGQARQIELPSVLTHAAAVKTTARSRRNDVVVAAFLGFLLGLLAAIAWEPIAARRTR